MENIIKSKGKIFVPILMSENGFSPDKLYDKFGRRATSLRISVTDNCNLRCQYCMPEEGVDFTSKKELLSFEEITRLVKIAHHHGITRIRLTGGEPLVRKNLSDLIRMIKTIMPNLKISMTTNGILLKKNINKLIEAGLDSINISLDTFIPQKFSEITRRDYFQQTMEGIYLALASTLKVKINVVALKNFNDDEICDFVDFALKNNVTIRFIEWMPFAGNQWLKPEFISAQELRNIITDAGYLLTPVSLDNPSQTSRDYTINNSNFSRIGFIASVTESFCQACDRLRLTADGKLRPCLHSSIETNLKLPMRLGATDESLSTLFKETIWNKPKEHPDFMHPKYEGPESGDRPMIKIGG